MTERFTSPLSHQEAQDKAISEGFPESQVAEFSQSWIEHYIRTEQTKLILREQIDVRRERRNTEPLTTVFDATLLPGYTNQLPIPQEPEQSYPA